MEPLATAVLAAIAIAGLTVVGFLLWDERQRRRDYWDYFKEVKKNERA